MFASLALAALLAQSGPQLPPGDPTQEGEAPTPSATKTVADLLDDLRGSDASKRLYAARSLRTKLRRAQAVEAKGNPESIRYLEALSTLDELETRIPHACMSAFTYPNVTGPCADMFVMLDVREAVPALQELRTREKRESVLRKLDEAITALGGPAPLPGSANPKDGAPKAGGSPPDGAPPAAP